MLNKALTAFILLFLFLLSPFDADSASPVAQNQTPNAQRPTLNSGQRQNGTSGVLQKMIVENGAVTMDLDLARLNGITSMAPQFDAWRFDVAGNSFFSILVFNDLLRGPEQGSMALIPQGSSPAGVNNVPAA